MAQFPQFPVHVQRALADCGHMPLDEFGAYWKLLFVAWLQPDCGIPDDDEWIARRLGVHGNRWHRLRPKIIPFFDAIGGRLYQKSQGIEREFLLEKSEKNRGKANKRWEEFRRKLLLSQETADAVAMPRQCQTDAPTLTLTLTPTRDSSNDESPPLSPPKKSRTPKAAKIDMATWMPDADCRQLAESVGLSPDTIAEQIHDWSANVEPQTKRYKLDPYAFWRNWCRRECERANNGPGRVNGHGPAHGNRRDSGGVMEAAARIIARRGQDPGLF